MALPSVTELPPLPRGDDVASTRDHPAFTKKQMIEFAQEAVHAERMRCRAAREDDDPDADEARTEAAYERQQERLMESGGPDDSQYRADLIAAGRGHLLR